MAQNIAQPEAIKTGCHNDNAGLLSFQKLTPRQKNMFDPLIAFISSSVLFQYIAFYAALRFSRQK